MFPRRRLVGAGAMATAIAAGGAGAAQADTGTLSTGPGSTHTKLIETGTQAASSNWAHLTIRHLGNSQYSVTVSGRAANLTTVTPDNLSIKLYGENQFFDEHLFDSHWHSTSADGGFWVQFTVPGYTLDEDWGQDEVYARVSVWHPGTAIRSNTVKGYY